MTRLNQWMGEIFYRGIDPIEKGYAELRYLHEWHELIAETEKKAMENA